MVLDNPTLYKTRGQLRRDRYQEITNIYEDQYPEGMKNFVNLWLETDIHLRIQKECGPKGIYYQPDSDMRLVYYYYLVNKFLNTEFQDQSIYKKVRDLPREDRYLAIDCLSYFLGMNPHNGNYHLLQIVKKFRELQN